MSLYLLELYKDFYNLFIILAIFFGVIGLASAIPAFVEIACDKSPHPIIKVFRYSLIITLVFLIIICFLPSPELVNSLYKIG